MRLTFICSAKHKLAHIFTMCNCRCCSPTNKRRSGVRRQRGKCGKNSEADVLDKDNPERLLTGPACFCAQAGNSLSYAGQYFKLIVTYFKVEINHTPYNPLIKSNPAGGQVNCVERVQSSCSRKGFLPT